MAAVWTAPGVGAAAWVRATVGAGVRSAGATAGDDGAGVAAFAVERPAAGTMVDGWRGDNSHAITVAKMIRPTTPIGSAAGGRDRFGETGCSGAGAVGVGSAGASAGGSMARDRSSGRPYARQKSSRFCRLAASFG